MLDHAKMYYSLTFASAGRPMVIQRPTQALTFALPSEGSTFPTFSYTNTTHSREAEKVKL